MSVFPPWERDHRGAGHLARLLADAVPVEPEVQPEVRRVVLLGLFLGLLGQGLLALAERRRQAGDYIRVRLGAGGQEEVGRWADEVVG